MPCNCCVGDALDIFSERGARRELRRYLREGLGGTDAKLIAAWAEEGGLAEAAVLEVGGGIGQVQAELLRRGAASGRVVEVVSGYEGAAAELASAVDVTERTWFVVSLVRPLARGPGARRRAPGAPSHTHVTRHRLGDRAVRGRAVLTSQNAARLRSCSA